MDKIPLQTLKIREIVPAEDQINELSVQLASVRRNFKPTVHTRREFEPEDDVDFDPEYEKELNKIDKYVDESYLKATMPKIEAELKLWTDEYKSLLDEYRKLHDDDPKDQILLKQSDERIKAKLSRVEIVENIKATLLKEVQKICLRLEKTKCDAEKKLNRTSTNYKEIIRYLNRGFEAERVNHAETVHILRKLEQSLRETINKFEDSQAKSAVLVDELKKTKLELHHCQRDLAQQESNAKRSATLIRRLEQELITAQDRAEFAEESLSKLHNKH